MQHSSPCAWLTSPDVLTSRSPHVVFVLQWTLGCLYILAIVECRYHFQMLTSPRELQIKTIMRPTCAQDSQRVLHFPVHWPLNHIDPGWVGLSSTTLGRQPVLQQRTPAGCPPRQVRFDHICSDSVSPHRPRPRAALLPTLTLQMPAVSPGASDQRDPCTSLYGLE